MADISRDATATLSQEETIFGIIEAVGGLEGELSIGDARYEPYKDTYIVQSKVDEDYQLETLGLVMTDNLTVKKISYFEEENAAGGLTAYIGKEEMNG